MDETHWACNNRLRKEGEKASCCKCNPHYDFDCGDDEEINKFKEQPRECKHEIESNMCKPYCRKCGIELPK